MQARQSAALAASRIAARGFESLLQIAKSAVSRSREVGDSLITNPRQRIEIRSPIAKSGIRCRVAGRIGCGIAAHAPDALRRYSRPCINSCCTCARRTQAILTSVHYELLQCAGPTQAIPFSSAAVADALAYATLEDGGRGEGGGYGHEDSGYAM